VGSSREQSPEHQALVILAAEETGEAADFAGSVVDIEVEDGAILRDGAQAGQQIAARSVSWWGARPKDRIARSMRARRRAALSRARCRRSRLRLPNDIVMSPD